MHCTCNGAATNGTAGAVNSDGLLAKKVPNHNGTGLTNKKPAVSLTHLPKRPPVDIEFKNLVYNVFEGRKKGEFTRALFRLRTQLASLSTINFNSHTLTENFKLNF